MTSLEQSLVTAAPAPVMQPPSDDKSQKVSCELAPLRGLPTPARRRTASNVAALPQSMTAPPSGPAPWELPDSAATTSQQSGYRELLQLRGQNAMHRSRISGSSPPPPPPVTAATLDSALAGQQVSASALWCMGNEATMQQVHMPSCHFQPMVGTAVDGAGAQWNPTQLMLPIPSRHDAPLLQPVPLSQQALPPWTSRSLDGSPSSCVGSPCSPQELMTTLMGSGAFAFDDQQIAEALRAAAPCVYDD